MSKTKHAFQKQQNSSQEARKRTAGLTPLFVNLQDGSLPLEMNEESIKQLRKNIQAWTKYIDRLGSSKSMDTETKWYVARALLRRGIAHTLLDEWPPAFSDLSHVIVLNVGEAETNTAYLYRARVQDALEQDEAAIRDWTFVLTCIEQVSSQSERFSKELAAVGYTYRARLYARLGNYKQSISDCDSALLFDPSYAEAYSVRGGAYNHLKKWTNALTDCTTAIGLEKKAIHFYRRGLVQKQIGNYDQAFADFEQAHLHEPKNEIFNREYAQLLMLRLIHMEPSATESSVRTLA